MRRHVKIRALSTRMPLRKAALSANSAARGAFPAWIDANDSVVAFPAKTATPRVRDGLVLRVVPKGKTAKRESLSHGRGGR